MSDDLELRKAFFVESGEILERLQKDVAALAASPGDAESLNSVFRGVHTIKGNSSFLSLVNVTKLSHAAETLLDQARQKKIPVDGTVVAIVRRALDDLRVMIVEQDLKLDVSPVTSAIQRFLAGDRNAAAGLGAEPAPAVRFETGSFVRVEEGKIGRILTLASELELVRYGLERIPEKIDALGPEAADVRFEVDLQVSKLSRLARSLSSLVFGVRLVPVNQVFQRFPRVVKDLAAKLGKDIELKVMNGEAELDRTIVEAIADPMTHLIRNSADHGIETAEERRKAGKPGKGIIRLNSYVRGIFVYIEISDDGRGIDGDKILAKAVEKGIVPADKASGFTEQQKLGLIFAPGFSTAEKVTDISGRGVGMDVVKSNINKLKGTVIIESVAGKGTVIQLRFPMSMVVLFSLFLNVGGTACAIPMEQIDESMDYQPGELLQSVPAGEDPEGYLRVYSLRALLWGNGGEVRFSGTFHMLRLRGGGETAFIVDEFDSIEDAIVQSVDSYIAALPGLQGATVRKDGSVALVLNTESLAELAKRAEPFAYVKKRAAVAVDVQGLTNFLEMSKAG